MYVKYKMAVVVTFIAVGLLTWLNIGYAIDPQPNPGMPVQPVPELPKVKPPGIPPKPDLLISTSGGGLGICLTFILIIPAWDLHNSGWADRC